MSFMITTGFGAGVAVDKASGKRIYMKMITGGVNLGAGAGMYQVPRPQRNPHRHALLQGRRTEPLTAISQPAGLKTRRRWLNSSSATATAA